MSPPKQSSLRNRLLSRLSAEAFAQVSPHLAPIDLPKDTLLAQVNEPADKVCFLESGVGSVVAVSPEGQESEVGLVGWEGFLPTCPALGVSASPTRSFIQIKGEGFAIPISVFSMLMEENAEFRRLNLRFIQAQTVQTSFTALSNAVHHIDERLARWLLMCHDRVEGDKFSLTHEFVSLMLAVRRPGVTTALQTLKTNGLIDQSRGQIVIRDRQALEEFAHDSYGIPESEYARLIGPIN